jgi:hypothetical protein
MPDASAPVAGWYADPDNSASDRWWDGAAWSEHRRAHDGAAVERAAPAPDAPVPVQYAPVIPTLPPKNTIAMAGLIVAVCSVPFSFIGGSFFSVIGGVTAGLLAGAGLTRSKRLLAAGVPTNRRNIAITGLVIGYGGAAAALVWTILSIAQFFGSF